MKAIKKLYRKDPIILTPALIGRELYFNKKELDMTEVLDLTPKRRYIITEIESHTRPPYETVSIVDDAGDTRYVYINRASVQLNCTHRFVLAKIKDPSKQSIVRTKSGRKL